MDNLDFIKKLYNGKNCYSDHMSEEQLELLHLKSEVEKIIVEKVNENKIVLMWQNMLHNNLRYTLILHLKKSRFLHLSFILCRGFT